MSAGKSYVVVDGQNIEMDKVTEVSETAKSTAGAQTIQDIAKYTGYIGFNVKGNIIDENKNSVLVTGRVKRSFKR